MANSTNSISQFKYPFRWIADSPLTENGHSNSTKNRVLSMIIFKIRLDYVFEC